MKFNHLKENNQSYFTHFKDALFYSFCSLKASFCFLVHGLYPDMLIFTGSKEIEKLNLNLRKNLKKQM